MGDTPRTATIAPISSAEFSPTGSPGAAPAEPSCIACSNVPTWWMITKDYECDTAPDWLIRNNCINDPLWVGNNYCETSCQEAGYGYHATGSCCSSTPTTRPVQVPTVAPIQWPTKQPTDSPIEQPTGRPTDRPTEKPTSPPTKTPSRLPSYGPTNESTEEPTEAATEAPTEKPSRGPSYAPTERPTDQPTESPSKSPSAGPTSDPTMQPSAGPTESPSGRPTSPPTDQPTPRPSASPSASPSAEPTGPPSWSPSAFPSWSPSASPTDSPSTSPSGSPTGSPSASPTNSPSASPSASPTPQPTYSPTQSPTLSNRPTPLIWPSASPTISTMPTADPTSVPSASPSASPTGAPSAAPTSSPSAKPSATHTEAPSASPSTPGPTNSNPTTSRPTTFTPTTLAPAAPTPDPTATLATYEPSTAPSPPTVEPRNRYEVRSLMALVGAGELDQDAIDAWVDITESRIRGETDKIIGAGGDGLDVVVRFNDQGVLEDGRALSENGGAASDVGGEVHVAASEAPGIDGGYLRRLQSNRRTTAELQIDFTTRIEFNSGEDDWDPNEMVAAGFETLNQQEGYLYALKAADNVSFGDVKHMAMEVDGALVTETKVPNENLTHDSTLYYIIGGTVAGSLLGLAVVAVAYKKRSRSRRPSRSLPQVMRGARTAKSDAPSGDSLALPEQPKTGTTPTIPSSQNYFGTIESREGPDDVSTLGEPFFSEGAAEPQADNTVTESMVSSEQRMFEYGVGRERLGTGDPSTVTGGAMGSNPKLFGDDPTYEAGYRTPDGSYEEGGRSAATERLVVTAPSGKLGIVVDNQTGDLPIVHAIKETSVLRGEVRVGDSLVSVDQVDCRGMSAAQVSRLISSKIDEPERSLVLLRGVAGNGCC